MPSHEETVPAAPLRVGGSRETGMNLSHLPLEHVHNRIHCIGASLWANHHSPLRIRRTVARSKPSRHHQEGHGVPTSNWGPQRGASRWGDPSALGSPSPTHDLASGDSNPHIRMSLYHIQSLDATGFPPRSEFRHGRHRVVDCGARLATGCSRSTPLGLTGGNWLCFASFQIINRRSSII
jgi:hypothetical protein